MLSLQPAVAPALLPSAAARDAVSVNSCGISRVLAQEVNFQGSHTLDVGWPHCFELSCMQLRCCSTVSSAFVTAHARVCPCPCWVRRNLQQWGTAVAVAVHAAAVPLAGGVQDPQAVGS